MSQTPSRSKRAIQAALAKPVDRKEFLARAGALTISALGITAVLRELMRSQGQHQPDTYGASTYGDHYQH